MEGPPKDWPSSVCPRTGVAEGVGARSFKRDEGKTESKTLFRPAMEVGVLTVMIGGKYYHGVDHIINTGTDLSRVWKRGQWELEIYHQ